MVQATGFQRAKRLRAADIDDVREMCFAYHSSRPHRPIFRVRRAPDIETMERAICGAASASHILKPVVLRTYFAQDCSDALSTHTTMGSAIAERTAARTT